MVCRHRALPSLQRERLTPMAMASIALTSSSQGDGNKVSALQERISVQPGEKVASGVLEIWDLLGPDSQSPAPGPGFPSLRETKRKGIGFNMMSLKLTRVPGKARRLHARFHLLQQARLSGD